MLNTSLHRGAFCQFTFRWIRYYDSNKSTALETGKSHLCALHCFNYERALIVFFFKKENGCCPDTVRGLDFKGCDNFVFDLILEMLDFI